MITDTLSRSTLVLMLGGLCLFGCSSSESSVGDNDVSAVPVPSDDAMSEDIVPSEESTAAPFACEDSTVACAPGRGCYSGVCVIEPPEDSSAVLTDPTGVTPKPVSGEGPNLSCMDTSPSQPTGPASTTMYGAVTRFGSGLITHDVKIEVFLAADWDPSVCAAESDVDDAIECYRRYGAAEHEDEFGLAPVAEVMSVPAAVTVDPEEVCVSHADCPLGYECLEGDLDKTCVEQFGVFEIADLPTNTEFVVRAYATTFERKWHDVYTFGVYLFADQVGADGRYHYDVTMVSDGQWQLTANIAGIEIDEGNGAIGGRVRDCRTAGQCDTQSTSCHVDADCAEEGGCTGARDSWFIGEASVNLETPAARVVYFNNNEDDTVPLNERTTTNILGRYAALDIAPGWNRIAGAVRAGGEVVSVGGSTVYVVPQALAIVGWPGYQPHWNQE